MVNTFDNYGVDCALEAAWAEPAAVASAVVVVEASACRKRRSRSRRSHPLLYRSNNLKAGEKIAYVNGN